MFLSVVICRVFFSAVISGFAQERINLTVADFEARNVSQMDAATVSDFLRTELVKSGVFNVVERKNMEKILAEQRFQMTGCTTQECAVKMGKILNAQKVIIGNVAKLGIVYHINANITDVESGRIEISERVTCISEFDFPEKTAELARMLASKFIRREAIDRRGTFVSNIIERDRRIVLNRGRRDGVKKRDVYEIKDGSKRVALAIVESVEWEESIARVLEWHEGRLEVGQICTYRTHFPPYTGGLWVGVNNREDSSLRPGVGGFWEYITPSHLGIHLNLGVLGIVNQIKDTNERNYTIIYPLSLILRYNVGSTFAPISP